MTTGRHTTEDCDEAVVIVLFVGCLHAVLTEFALQVEEDWRSQLSRRTIALSDANRRFTELESVMRRIAARSSVG